MCLVRWPAQNIPLLRTFHGCPPFARFRGSLSHPFRNWTMDPSLCLQISRVFQFAALLINPNTWSLYSPLLRSWNVLTFCSDCSWLCVWKVSLHLPFCLLFSRTDVKGHRRGWPSPGPDTFHSLILVGGALGKLGFLGTMGSYRTFQTLLVYLAIQCPPKIKNSRTDLCPVCPMCE